MLHETLLLHVGHSFLILLPIAGQKRKLIGVEFVSQLRIRARSIVLPWDHVICHLPNPDGAELPVLDASEFPGRYVDALNEMIMRQSERTAVVLLNMPPPPANAANYERYMENVDRMTVRLPPTLLVHGLSSVISTAL